MSAIELLTTFLFSGRINLMPENSKGGLLEKIIPVLLILTIAMAFAVGVLWQKVSMLEGGGLKVTSKTSDTGGSAPQPAVNGKLSSDQAKKVPEVSDTDHIRGSKDVQVFLIEYSDLECPFCKRFHPTVQQAVDEYKGKVAWVYRHFPLDTLHPKADKEAEAAECAFDQKRDEGFWAYVDRVFEVTPSNNGLDATELPKIASYIGLDVAEFNSCLSSGKFKDKVEAQYQGGVGAGITGTPGSFVVNKKGETWSVPGAVPYETLKSTIEESLK